MTQSAAGARSAFVSAIQAWHLAAGKPSTRKIAAAARTDVSHTTVAELLTGRRIPGWAATEAIVEALGGDVSVARPLWQDTQEQPDSSRAPELTAINVCVTALTPLSQTARRRVLDYLQAWSGEDQ